MAMVQQAPKISDPKGPSPKDEIPPGDFLGWLHLGSMGTGAPRRQT